MITSRSYPVRAAGRVHIFAALVLLAACRQAELNEADNLPSATDEPAFNLPAVAAPAPLDRAGLLAAVAQASSAQASGADDAEAQRALDGRQFELRIRFGCRGPSAQLRDEWLGWSHDSETGTLRVRARPTLSAEDDLVRELGGDQFEAVEGFWIPRPWLLQPVCPATAAVSSAAADPAADTEPDERSEEPASGRAAAAGGATEATTEPVPSWPRVGMAQFFTETDPRTERRSMRPYEAVKNLDPKAPIGSQGFNLVLSGRLKALRDKRVIACAAKGSDRPPECVISVDFDRVWMERPGTREVIAKWGGG